MEVKKKSDVDNPKCQTWLLQFGIQYELHSQNQLVNNYLTETAAMSCGYKFRRKKRMQFVPASILTLAWENNIYIYL